MLTAIETLVTIASDGGEDAREYSKSIVDLLEDPKTQQLAQSIIPMAIMNENTAVCDTIAMLHGETLDAHQTQLLGGVDGQHLRDDHNSAVARTRLPSMD